MPHYYIFKQKGDSEKFIAVAKGRSKNPQVALNVYFRQEKKAGRTPKGNHWAIQTNRIRIANFPDKKIQNIYGEYTRKSK